MDPFARCELLSSALLALHQPLSEAHDLTLQPCKLTLACGSSHVFIIFAAPRPSTALFSDVRTPTRPCPLLVYREF